jgi:hypothetical protein
MTRRNQCRLGYPQGPNMDDPIICIAGTTAQYYHQDSLGSVVGHIVGEKGLQSCGNSIKANRSLIV